jgi:hypothetical protein
VMPGNGRMGAMSSACTQVYPGAFGPNCEMSPSDLLTLLRNHIRARFVSPSAGYRLVSKSFQYQRQYPATSVSRQRSVPPKYLLASGGSRCYPGFMTVFRHDYGLLAGMPGASTVALSCADTSSAMAAVWTMSERCSSRQPRCFRLFRQPSAPAAAVGVCPGRKQGAEENSHKYLSFAVLPARNVA